MGRQNDHKDLRALRVVGGIETHHNSHDVVGRLGRRQLASNVLGDEDLVLVFLLAVTVRTVDSAQGFASGQVRVSRPATKLPCPCWTYQSIMTRVETPAFLSPSAAFLTCSAS
jgi:hypothetical protein